MSRSGRDEPDPEELREQAAENEAIADALEDLVIELRDEPVKESRLEGLFDEATTSDPRIWNTVTAFIDVEDGDAVVTDESKLAAGKWAPEIVDDCDTMVTIDIQRGLMPDDFTYQVGRELQDRITEFGEEAAELRQRAAKLEGDDGASD
ncbi:hypothetical protein C491_01671 [Natronococcus amylolyticus DSM 10524]|uniref:Uncharacterized protein n=1 Tax=Natronococcus amylolyticus DSM 10524 TaxID=1227497 RepID=L9XIB1_9EURY|nr:hypothetical protein [Natronococcus amylolyticus]ELY61141.1 hypothetical protein C491_01671 [Natronococcus amylolyticus DSM 10524]